MSDKRFPPSIQRLRKARRDGKVVKSRLLATAFGWLALFSFFMASRPWVRIGTLIHWFKFKVLSPGASLKHALLFTDIALLLVIGCFSVASVIAGLLQTRGLLSAKQVLPDLNRLQPMGYLKRLRESVVDASLGLVRLSLLVLLVTPVVVGYLWNASVLFRAPDEWLIPSISSALVSVVVRGVGLMIVLGGCAYGLVWWKFMKEHRMSFEELREEHKESEGDPHVKAARRHEHMALAMSEIEKRVRNSKVVVVRRRPSSEPKM